ncbi:MAG: esterase/lipase family protein [Verrucomicrobiales bacterium]
MRDWFSSVSEKPAPADYLVLLHGLGRTRRSFRWMAGELNRAGYHVLNVGYPSRSKPLSALAADHIAPIIKSRCIDSNKRVHFVAHSMGCIVLREFLCSILPSEDERSRVGRAVMIAPPNQGSDIIDAIGSIPLVRAVLGPAAAELATHAQSPIHTLGPIPIETGIIMGNKAAIPFFRGVLSGISDGIVTVERGRLEGMRDFVVLPVDHTFAIRRRIVRDQVLHFIETGLFNSLPA